jgi:hypothetical protein
MPHIQKRCVNPGVNGLRLITRSRMLLHGHGIKLILRGTKKPIKKIMNCTGSNV